MTDDQLADAWESFATALREVPGRRMERWLSRPTYLDPLRSSAREIDTARFQANALAMAGAHPDTYATNRGTRVEMFGYALVTYPAGLWG